MKTRNEGYIKNNFTRRKKKAVKKSSNGMKQQSS